MEEISYRVQSLQKSFGAVQAISDATFEVRKGSVHGVIGKNGAGKSVLMNIVSGIMEASGGQLEILGEPVDLDDWDSREANRRGISLIPQEPPSLPHLTVEDYLFLGDRSAVRWGGLLDRTRIREQVREINRRLDLGVRPKDPMIRLPIEVQQLLAFGKAVFLEDKRVILLDEITASLTGERRTSLLRELRELATDRSFTLISHRIGEIMSTCDRVTVMRDGVSIETLDVADTTAEELAQMIVGDAPTTEVPPHALDDRGEVVLRLADVSWAGSDEPVSLDVREREIIGLAGVQGSGMEGLILGLAGIEGLDGVIEIDGRRVRPSSPRAAAAAGIAYLPKKREEYATIPKLDVFENLMLPVVATKVGLTGLWRRKQMLPEAQATVRDLHVKPQRVDVPIGTLSGGNRQKVMLGRLRSMQPRVYVLDEPTRGVDIATKPALLRVVREDLASKAAIIVTSEAEEELVEICDRILVFLGGRLVAEFRSTDENFTVRDIYRATQGVTAS